MSLLIPEIFGTISAVAFFSLIIFNILNSKSGLVDLISIEELLTIYNKKKTKCCWR